MSDAIRAVRALTATLALPSPLQLGPVCITEREYAAVRVETDDGLVGKAYCLSRNAPVVECVERLIAPVVLGRDPEHVERCWQECFRATVMVGRVGLVMRALGLVDIALWDIAAQRAGRPLWMLLGGSEDRVRAMIVAAYPIADRSPESLADDVVRLSRAGYSLLKVARDGNIERMRELLTTARDGLPASAELVVDAGFGWVDAETALAEIAGWDGVPLAWLEDPLVPEDISGCAAMRSDGPYPIGIGDEVSDPNTYRALVAAGALDLVRLDVVAIGGITPARKIAELAVAHTLPLSLHVYPQMSVHLAMTMPGGQGIVEQFDPDVPGGNPLDPAHRLCCGGPRIESGWMLPPVESGLGFDLDWERFAPRSAQQENVA